MNSDWSMMRVLPILVSAIIPAAAQVPLISLVNASRPGNDFQIGDRFEIVITAAPNQFVSVRTSRQGRTDWSPVVGATDSAGRWSTAGQFEKRDFGSWAEAWTVGGKLASPVLQFSVNAPCVANGYRFLFMSGANVMLRCETTEGTEAFTTPGFQDSFRTPDGRLVNGRAISEQTREQYQSEFLEHLMANGMGTTRLDLQSSQGGLGDETADLVSNLIGVNALKEDEIENLLVILRSTFEEPETIQPTAREPVKTLLLLRHLADVTGPGSLKREIEETIAYFQAR